jgi:RNA polymerase sigma factor (sigma-70 family)
MDETACREEARCLDGLEEVEALYADHAVRVRRLVRLSVTASDAVIEDACQVAWMRLVLHRARVCRDGALSWVVRVATNEARRQARRAGRDLSLEQVTEDRGDAVATPELMDELAERRERLARIATLPERQQRVVWLQGLGFSYAEMAGRTGDSRRTVERQLTRARGALARAAS